jgi:hypothetical protein
MKGGNKDEKIVKTNRKNWEISLNLLFALFD